jgi:broad specificity phosphatase PhoE
MLSLFSSTLVAAAPAQVIIIRHGEKSLTGPDLDPRGYQRAQDLVEFFKTDKAMLQYGTPAAIYAMEPKHEGNPNKTPSSLRAVETVQPLANALNLTIRDNAINTDYEAVVSEVMQNPQYNGRMVLICWEHKNIPPMAEAFGATTAPEKWDKKIFDRVWVLNFKNGRFVSFEDLPENLLPGDSAN